MKYIDHVAFFVGAFSVVAGVVYAGIGSYQNHDYTMTTDSHVTYNEEIIELSKLETEIVDEEIVETVEEDLNQADDFLIACAVEAEAGEEPLVGRVAVAATILNRSDAYDMSIPEVIKVGYCTPAYYASAESMEAVRIARENRDLFPRNMMYFKTQSYHTFEHAEDYTIIGHHYFSLNELYDEKTGEKL